MQDAMENSTSPSNSQKRPEDFETESPKKIKTVTEESNFVQLFHDALEIIQKKINITTEDIEEGANICIKAFRDQSFTDINFDKWNILCGFFYRYSPLAAGVARCRLLDAIQNCKELHTVLNKKELNVVSLGSGSGCDVVALCSALYEKTTCVNLQITLVDKAKKWASFFNIVEFLLQVDNYGNASSMFQKKNIHTVFMAEDVVEDLEQDTAYSKSLRQADVVSVVRLLSMLTFDQRPLVTKNVVKGMKPGALLLYIESPDIHISTCKIFPGLTEIYSEDAESMVEDYFFPESALVNIGRGIAKQTKAHVKVFIKE